MSAGRWFRAAGLAAALAVAGAATGLASVAVHDRLWGLPLAVLASLAGLLALPPRWSTRPPFAAGWGVLVLAAAQPRPEGDRLVDADGPGWLLVALAALLPLLAVGTAWSAGGGRASGRPSRGPRPGPRATPRTP